jgi:hypothetical protein
MGLGSKNYTLSLHLHWQRQPNLTFLSLNFPITLLLNYLSLFNILTTSSSLT